MPGQRQLALRALEGLLRWRAACIARGEAPPHRRLPEMLPVAIRCKLVLHWVLKNRFDDTVVRYLCPRVRCKRTVALPPATRIGYWC